MEKVMKPSLYRIEICDSDGVIKNTYAFNADDAERYISETEHLKKTSGGSVKLYVTYI
jgi:hypothetical protein